MALGAPAALWRLPASGSRLALLLGLPAWLAFVGALSYFGVLSNPALRPPGAICIFITVFLSSFFFAVRSKATLDLALKIPLRWMIGAQPFRVIVELFPHGLRHECPVPKLMPCEGGNIDIFIGLPAPNAYWLATRGRNGQRAALVWNVNRLRALLHQVTALGNEGAQGADAARPGRGALRRLALAGLIQFHVHGMQATLEMAPWSKIAPAASLRCGLGRRRPVALSDGCLREPRDGLDLTRFAAVARLLARHAGRFDPVSRSNACAHRGPARQRLSEA